METSLRSLGLGVLVVEPDRQTRESLSVYLGMLGCIVSVARSAAEAATAMRAGRFDVIIADYLLPDGNGVSVLQSSAARQERTVRILTTSYLPDLSPIPEDLIGIDDVVHKPFTGSELRNRIGRHVEGRAGERIARIAKPVEGPHP